MRNHRLLLKADGRILVIVQKEIHWLEAEGHYVQIHLKDETLLMRSKISQMEQQLNPHDFLRINRSTIVNLDFIQEMKSTFRGSYRMILKDGTELSMSPGYRKKLYSKFHQVSSVAL
jgi:two-component system LytT family response regulator